jgi:hypothetical protein
MADELYAELTALLEGNTATAFEMLSRAIRSPGTTIDPRLLIELQNSLALTFLAAGDLDNALQSIAQEIKTGVGLDVELERQLVAGLIMLAQGNHASAKAAVVAVAEQAASCEYRLHHAIAKRLLIAISAPPLLAELPRLLLQGR